MQHLVQAAIADKLLADATVVSFITTGKSSPFNQGKANVYAEGDVRPSNPLPYIVLKYIRQRPGMRRNEFVQTWHIQIYNKDRGYYAIESLMENIFEDFQDSSLAIDPSSHLFCLPQGVQFISSLRSYDPVFKTEFVSAVLDIHLMRRNAA